MKGTLLFLAGLLLGANLVYFWNARNCRTSVPVTANTPLTAAGPDTASTAPPSAVAPPTVVTPDTRLPAAPVALPPAAPANPNALSGLLLPVDGVRPADLSDTFNDHRGTERIHEALDIMATRGTPVRAASDGFVVKLFTSKAGGLTLYEFEPSQQYALYYAHLDRYADGITEGMAIKRGQVIGYVGSTGNADPSAPHLHFAIFQLDADKRWWKGTPINPYPLLHGPA